MDAHTNTDDHEAATMSAKEYIDHLASVIGPRPACSDRERQAAQWLKDHFEKAGLEVRIENFRCPKAFAPMHLAIVLLAVAAFIIAWSQPAPSIALGAASLACFVAQSLGIQTCSRLMPRGTSQNVIGRLSALTEPARRIVVTAHLDTAYAGMAFRPWLVRWFRAIFLLLLVALVAIVFIAVMRMFAPRWIVFLGIPLFLHLLWCVILLAHQTWIARPVAGAGDNASGVAALALLAENLSPLPTTEVWLVGTGAEEAGLFGIIDLLSAHKFDRQTSLFLNIDNVGAEPLRIIEREGILAKMNADSEMVEAAKHAAQELLLDVVVDTYRTLPVESAVPLLHGFRAVSIMGTLRHWHQESDVVENVDAGVAARAALRAQATVLGLAA